LDKVAGLEMDGWDTERETAGGILNVVILVAW